jgi:hypothetical protein
VLHTLDLLRAHYHVVGEGGAPSSGAPSGGEAGNVDGSLRSSASNVDMTTTTSKEAPAEVA